MPYPLIPDHHCAALWASQIHAALPNLMAYFIPTFWAAALTAWSRAWFCAAPHPPAAPLITCYPAAASPSKKIKHFFPPIN
jgi:hypothetical protein